MIRRQNERLTLDKCDVRCIMYITMTMKRTQIYLPEDLHKELLLTARREQTTLSELIRKGAKKIVTEGQNKDTSWKVMEKLAHYNLKNLPTSLSQKHDKYYIEAILGGRDIIREKNTR